MPSTDIKDYWRRSWGIGDRERVKFNTGQLVKPSTTGIRPGYGGPGSGQKKGSIPVQSSAQKKATYYKKLLNDLPEGYLEDYKKIFLNDRGDGTFSRKPGDAPEGLLDMEKKYRDILKGKTKNITRRVGEMNSAILQSLQEEGKIVSGLSDAKKIRKADLKIVGDIDLVAPKGKVTHHFMPLAGIEGEKINLSSTKNTAFIDKKLNAKMSPYDKRLKANQKEQIKLLNEKPLGWEKKIERLNYKAKNIYKEAGKKVPKSRGLLGYSQIVVKPDGTYGIKVTGIQPKKSFAGLKGEEILYKNISKADKIKVQKIVADTLNKHLSVEDTTKLSKTIQSIMSKKNSGLNVVDIAKWGSAELGALDDIAGKLPSKALGAFGKLLKFAGVVAIPLDAVPFTEAHSKGLTPDVGAMNLAEMYSNLPGMIWEAGEWVASKVQGKEHEWKPFYEFEFGREYETKKLQETPLPVLEKRIDRWATDMAPAEEFDKISSYLDRRGIPGITNENMQLQQYEEELLKQMRIEKALADKEKKASGGLTGVDQYIINRGI